MTKYTSDNSDLSKKVAALEEVIYDLRLRLKKSETDRENAHETINELKLKLNIKKENLETKENELEESFLKQLEQKNLEINNLCAEKKELQSEHDEKVSTLQKRVQVTENSVKRLDKLLVRIEKMPKTRQYK